MRKFLIPIVAAASALAVAGPATAQWAPPVYRYQPYNYGNAFSYHAFAQSMEAMTDAQLGEAVTLPMGSKSRFEMLLGVKEHEMHHRAQLFLIERMVGIVPHLTRARQERQAAPVR